MCVENIFVAFRHVKKEKFIILSITNILFFIIFKTLSLFNITQTILEGFHKQSPIHTFIHGVSKVFDLL